MYYKLCVIYTVHKVLSLTYQCERLNFLTEKSVRALHTNPADLDSRPEPESTYRYVCCYLLLNKVVVIVVEVIVLERILHYCTQVTPKKRIFMQAQRAIARIVSPWA